MVSLISDIGAGFVILQYLFATVCAISAVTAVGAFFYQLLNVGFSMDGLKVISKSTDLIIGSFACILFVQLIINHWC